MGIHLTRNPLFHCNFECCRSRGSLLCNSHYHTFLTHSDPLKKTKKKRKKDKNVKRNSIEEVKSESSSQQRNQQQQQQEIVHASSAQHQGLSSARTIMQQALRQEEQINIALSNEIALRNRQHYFLNASAAAAAAMIPDQASNMYSQQHQLAALSNTTYPAHQQRNQLAVGASTNHPLQFATGIGIPPLVGFPHHPVVNAGTFLPNTLTAMLNPLMANGLVSQQQQDHINNLRVTTTTDSNLGNKTATTAAAATSNRTASTKKEDSTT